MIPRNNPILRPPRCPPKKRTKISTHHKRYIPLPHLTIHPIYPSKHHSTAPEIIRIRRFIDCKVLINTYRMLILSINLFTPSLESNRAGGSVCDLFGAGRGDWKAFAACFCCCCCCCYNRIIQMSISMSLFDSTHLST